MGFVPVPARGDIFLDARGEERALRVTGHCAEGLVVLSLWRGAQCTATARLSTSDASRLAALLAGLGAAAADPGDAGCDPPGVQAVLAR